MNGVSSVRLLLACLVGAAAVLAGVISRASAVVPPPDPGGSIGSCSYSGTTPSWSGVNYPKIGPCLSTFTSFYGYKTNASINCIADGYRAAVYYLQTDSNWIERWAGYRCNNGLWYDSDRWGYSERRVSEMRVGASVTWAMVQYRPA